MRNAYERKVGEYHRIDTAPAAQASQAVVDVAAQLDALELGEARDAVESVVAIAMARAFAAGRRDGIGAACHAVDAAGLMSARAVLWRLA